MNDREVVISPHMHVRCDGGNGLLGHPVEYMTLENGQVTCKYCGRRYVPASDPEVAAIRAHGVARAA